MSFRLTILEIRKLIEQPMVLVFLLASLLLNSVYILSAHLDKEYLNYIVETQKTTGTIMNNQFHLQLSSLPENKAQKRLKSETQELGNIFHNYSTQELAEEVIDMFGIKGAVAKEVAEKYQRLSPVVTKLDKEEASLEVAAGRETQGFFTFIRNRLFNAILTETLIFGVLLGLYSGTSEKLTKTDNLVLSSKTGRKIQVSKYFGSLILTLLFYLIVSGLSFSLFRLISPLQSLWQTSVSNQFHLNVYVPGIFEIPFMTWQPMTLFTYTWLSFIMGGFLVILFQGFSFFLGLWTNHLFQGFVILVSLLTLMIIISQLSASQNLWRHFSLCMWHPIHIWLNQGYWFTEMGPFSTIPFQEVWAIGLNFILLILFAFVTSNYYLKKEVK